MVTAKDAQSKKTVACINCKDKPKFGGPGRKKQCCVKRKCKYESSHAF